MKLLKIKYKMHKLVNLVFYLIIFIFGFLLGFSAEKINFNKLISQFLFIDSVSAEEFVGKTINVTKFNYAPNGFVHVTALIRTDDDAQIGNSVKTIFKGSDCVNVVNRSATGGSLFSDNSGEVSNSKYVSIISPEPTEKHTQIVNGTDVEIIMQDRVFNSKPTTPYIKVPILFFGTLPYSCKITDISISINGNQKEILKLGSFFSDELLTITDSDDNENTGDDNNENTGGDNNGDNTGGDNSDGDNTGGDNNDEDVSIEVINNTFYEFAKKIFGEVSEENQFIYDFITFGLVVICFTLFILIIGYIIKKIFGG